MESTFRPTPNGTIRLKAVTVQGSAPSLFGLAAGSGSVVLIQNRGSVPVLVEFGGNANMALPVAPSGSTPGSRSIPAGAATLARLQQNERHVAIAVASGSPDVEFTVGNGSGDYFGSGSSGGVSGSAGAGGAGAGNTEAAAFTTTNTSAIGALSVLVSAAYAGGKRSIINDGTVLLRLVNAAGVTTGGLALPAGAAYVIDGQNPLAAAVYAYAPSGSGSVSEIRQ